MRYPHSIEIKINFGNEKLAQIIKEAVEPDLNVLGINRTKVTLHVEGQKLIVFIESKDIVGLRASMNSTLRWIVVAHETTLL